MNSSELKGKKVIIAPFNTEAVILYHQLINDGVEVVAFMDSDVSLHNCRYNDTIIIPYIHFSESNTVAIIANQGVVPSEIIINELKKANYDDVEIIKQENIKFECMINEVAKFVDLENLYKLRAPLWTGKLKKKIIECSIENNICVNMMVLHVTTRCTLKCKGCSYLTDYFRPFEQKDSDFDKLIHSFNVLMKNIDYVNILEIIGGEPFLYKKLGDLINYIINSEYTNRIGKIVVITNGTVMPSEEMLESFEKSRHLTMIILSDYGRLSSKRFEIVSALNRHNCNYIAPKRTGWYLANQPIVPNENISDNAIKEKCDKCVCTDGGRLRVLENKVYSCHFMLFADACCAIPYDRRNYLDTLTDEINRNVLCHFINYINPGRAYCSAPLTEDGNTQLPIAEQTKEVKECVRFER